MLPYYSRHTYGWEHSWMKTLMVSRYMWTRVPPSMSMVQSTGHCMSHVWGSPSPVSCIVYCGDMYFPST